MSAQIMGTQYPSALCGQQVAVNLGAGGPTVTATVVDKLPVSGSVSLSLCDRLIILGGVFLGKGGLSIFGCETDFFNRRVGRWILTFLRVYLLRSEAVRV